jgi:PST family polysaccharide transporter
MSSYKEILRSSVIVGGSQVVIIIIGIVRTKIMAILLGPEGIGLTGLYQTTIGVIGNITALGLGYSGIREIAEANGSGDLKHVARVFHFLKRVPVYLGLIGFCIVVVLRKHLAWQTFGDTSQDIGIAIAGSILFFYGLQTPFSGLLQGMRRIKDLAIYNILGATIGTAVGIIFVYFWKTRGIAPSLAVVTASTVVTSWWFSRRIYLPPTTLSLAETWSTAIRLSRLGLAFTITGFISASAAYLTRWIVVHWLDMKAVGLYQATWTLASLYVNIILTAMGTDFYPRLTGVCRDNEMVNRLVNEQMEMGILMATPGVLALLIFSPIILYLFYTKEFLPASEIVRWQVLGVALRVMFWPLAYIPLAKGKSCVYMVSDGSLHVLLVLTLTVGVRSWGLEGTGLSFLVGNFIHGILLLIISRNITGFRINRNAQRTGILCIMSFIATLISISFLGSPLGITIGILVLCSATVICIKEISRLVGGNLFNRILTKFRYA